MLMIRLPSLESNTGLSRVTLLAIILLAAGVPTAVCWYRGGGEALRYWRGLEEQSAEVSGEFLAAVARRDSAAIAATASDSLVAWLQREGTPPELLSMFERAREFDSNPPRVHVNGAGATVTFEYQFDGSVRRGGLWIGIDLDRLVVTEFATMVTVN